PKAFTARPKIGEFHTQSLTRKIALGTSMPSDRVSKNELWLAIITAGFSKVSPAKLIVLCFVCGCRYNTDFINTAIVLRKNTSFFSFDSGKTARTTLPKKEMTKQPIP